MVFIFIIEVKLYSKNSVNLFLIKKYRNFTIHTESEKQENLLKTLFEELKVKFTISEKEEFTDWQKNLIDEGLKDIKEGRTISSEEVRKKARLCIK